jgi:hypothetical protein
MGGLQKVWTVYVPWSKSGPSKAHTTKRMAYKHALDEVYKKICYYQENGLLDSKEHLKFGNMCNCYRKNIEDVLTVPESDLQALLEQLNYHHFELLPYIKSHCVVIECDMAE